MNLEKLRQSETEVEKDGSQHDVGGWMRNLFILLSLVSCHLGCLDGALPVLSVLLSAWPDIHFLSLYGVPPKPCKCLMHPLLLQTSP